MKMLDQSTVTVPIYDIVIDSHINTRELDEAVIEEYRESMREYGESNWQSFWNESPRMTESGHLYSGFHTVTAAMREFGREYEINVIQEGKDWREAYFRATRMNATHGRRRTNAEKELAVRRWLEDDEMCQWTDGHIAKECLVSAPFVSKVARSLETISSRPTKRKFVDSDGEIQWQETKKIGTNQPTAYDPKAQIQTDYKAYLSHRDAAHDKWKAYCEQWEIPFNWENFCLWAEEHLDGEGCLSLINTEEATLDEIRERSLTWQKMKSAISGEARWVVRHRAGLDFQKADDPAEEPKEAETDLSEILTEASEEEKAKESLMNAYDDLTSEGYELWSKHLKRFISWTGLYDAAQSNWPALADWSEYSPDDNSEESLKLQVAIWKNFKADLDYTIRVINNEGAERGEIWLLKLLAIKPEPTPAYTEKDLWDLRAEIHDLLDDGIDAQAPGLAQVHKIPLDVVKAEIAQAKASLAIAESKPDLDGLRNNLERMQGSNTKPNPSILSQAYDVPEDVVRSEIENYDFTDGREPQKPPTDKTFEPPPSTNRGIVFQAHNEARAAYDAMMGGEPAAKVADKYWESFLAEAKRNAPRGKGLPRGDNTGTGNPYEKSQAKHIVGAWQWIAEQCRPPVQQNKPTEAEQKLIGLGLLERQPAVCHPPRPDWLRGWVYDVACRMSDFNVVIHGLNYEGEIGRLEFQPSIPLDADDLERIVAATREAIDVEIQEILAEHEENQEASQPQLGFETVKYAMRGA